MLKEPWNGNWREGPIFADRRWMALRPDSRPRPEIRQDLIRGTAGWRRWWSRSDSGDERRGWGGVERWGEAADDLQRLEGGLFIAGQRRGGGGTRRATCLCTGDSAESAGAAKAHGKRWEGDEEEADERQRLTEMSSA